MFESCSPCVRLDVHLGAYDEFYKVSEPLSS
jgi:hypothetical protein